MSAKKAASRKRRDTRWMLALTIVLALLCAVSIIATILAATQEKTIVAQVLTPDGKTSQWEITTNAQFLGQALLEKDLVAGVTKKYGLYVTTVNGLEADEEKHQWWCFSCNGVPLETMVDNTPIKDGDHFEITLTEGWDDYLN
jgi:hypothetical protein